MKFIIGFLIGISLERLAKDHGGFFALVNKVADERLNQPSYLRSVK